MTSTLPWVSLLCVRIYRFIGQSINKWANMMVKSCSMTINVHGRAVVFIFDILLGTVRRGDGDEIARGQRTGGLRMSGVDEVMSGSCSVSVWFSVGVWWSSSSRCWKNGSVWLSNGFQDGVTNFWRLRSWNSWTSLSHLQHHYRIDVSKKYIDLKTSH